MNRILAYDYSFGEKNWGDCVPQDPCETASIVSVTETLSLSDPTSVWSVEKPKKWCARGNACPYADCKFRHETCTHYWNAKRTGRGGCKHQVTDPRNNKSPAEGGCKYDHRIASTLTTFVRSVEIGSAEDLWTNFELEESIPSLFDVQEMDEIKRGILKRSLAASEENGVLEFEDFGNWYRITFN